MYRALGLAAAARADFIVAEDGTPYFLEINTLPGMTPTSLVPQEAAAVGIGYGELCEKIIAASLRARKEGMLASGMVKPAASSWPPKPSKRSEQDSRAAKRFSPP